MRSYLSTLGIGICGTTTVWKMGYCLVVFLEDYNSYIGWNENWFDNSRNMVVYKYLARPPSCKLHTDPHNCDRYYVGPSTYHHVIPLFTLLWRKEDARGTTIEIINDLGGGTDIACWLGAKVCVWCNEDMYDGRLEPMASKLIKLLVDSPCWLTKRGSFVV